MSVSQQPCGCRTTEPPYRRPWFYRPQVREWWYGWRALLPITLGGDEWCRRTLVVGWNFTGQVVIPMRHCRGCEWCGPDFLDGVNQAWMRAHNAPPSRYSGTAGSKVDAALGGGE